MNKVNSDVSIPIFEILDTIWIKVFGWYSILAGSGFYYDTQYKRNISMKNPFHYLYIVFAAYNCDNCVQNHELLR